MDYAVVAFGLNVVYFSLAIVIGWSLLRLLDWMSGIRFTENFEGIKDANMAMALYLGLRFVGVCVLASSFIR